MACEYVDLAVNIYMVLRHHQGMVANQHIPVDSIF